MAVERPKKTEPIVEETPQPQVRKVQPTIVENRAHPQIRAIAPIPDKNDMAWLLYVPTGNKLRVSRKHAEKMAKGNPKQYKVL